MMNNHTSLQQDHCPPGFKDFGSATLWSLKYKEWLKRRGFTEELRAIETSSRNAKRNHANKKQRKNNK